MTPKSLHRKIQKLHEYPPMSTDFEQALRRRGTWGKKPVWYRSQKQHWLGWLSEYHSPGAYGRKNQNGSAEFAYNHVVCPPMVFWLGEALGVPRATVLKAKQAALAAGPVLSAQCAAIRKHIPWEMIQARLSK